LKRIKEKIEKNSLFAYFYLKIRQNVRRFLQTILNNNPHNIICSCWSTQSANSKSHFDHNASV